MAEQNELSFESRDNEYPIRDPEFIFGNYKQEVVRFDDITILPQVRRTSNPILPELKEDIRRNDLKHPPFFAYMPRELFIEYLESKNTMYKTNIKIESFPQKEFYFVLISGETRTKALMEIRDEDNARYGVRANLQPFETLDDLLGDQIGENIHSMPRQEDIALTIVEHYRSGLKSGRWDGPDEYSKINKKRFSKKHVEDAIAFAELPSKIWDFIYEKVLYYGAGVELGKHMADMRKYVELKYDGASKEELEELLTIEMLIIVNKIIEAKLNSRNGLKKAQEKIRSLMADNMGYVDRVKNQKQQEQLEIFTDAEIKKYNLDIKKQLLEDYKAAMAWVKAPRPGALDTVLRLNKEITGIDISEEIIGVQESVNRYLGKEALESLRIDGKSIMGEYATTLDKELKIR